MVTIHSEGGKRGGSACRKIRISLTEFRNGASNSTTSVGTKRLGTPTNATVALLKFASGSAWP
jgi:hypothetical protein